MTNATPNTDKQICPMCHKVNTLNKWHFCIRKVKPTPNVNNTDSTQGESVNMKNPYTNNHPPLDKTDAEIAESLRKQLVNIAPNSTPNTDSTPPDEVDNILTILEGNRIDMPRFKREKIAKSQLTTLIALKVQEARIDELERIDGYAYGTDYGDYAQERLAALQKNKGEL